MAGGGWVNEIRSPHSKSASATLNRMTRIWRVALLTLLMALLPLRGWAWAVMSVPVAAPVAVQSEAAQPSCHGHQVAPDAPATDGASAATGHHAHTCSLCDLCHAGVIVPPSWAWFHDAPPVSPPSWAVSATHGRDGTDGLFRPPRA